MAETNTPLLIKRYASRRLYNTETSDYVTLEDIAAFIREGRDVQIVDLKSGDDLTRQYLLQIIAEHESRNSESILPLGVLTDLVRSYTSEVQSVMPQFLSASFDMFRESQEKMIENLAGVPGIDAMRVQQEAFLKAMTGGMPAMKNWSAPTMEEGHAPETESAEDLQQIKKQLSDLQDKLSKLDK
ncbi:polyhydroxyalkanoate synthesis repressor PhaR [Aliiroseovarius sp. PTFE2010]|uniref:polyhydroxyalkanoate synthesis repressor PhaR n=1 Tax=Aliiroseovarius sp. PTFE2010 TaxID=3417190 RepID=UPI003CEE6BF8